jgi:hypothetical protein
MASSRWNRFLSPSLTAFIARRERNEHWIPGPLRAAYQNNKKTK